MSGKYKGCPVSRWINFDNFVTEKTYAMNYSSLKGLCRLNRSSYSPTDNLFANLQSNQNWAKIDQFNLNRDMRI